MGLGYLPRNWRSETRSGPASEVERMYDVVERVQFEPGARRYVS